MHSVTDSATATRGTPRARQITRVAQELVADRGYTHVTVEDIAEHAGISRRTFFNHVDSKESAVLGSLPELTPELTARLRGEGDASTDAFAVTLEVGAAALDVEGRDVADWRRLHDVLVANPELIPRVKERIERLTRELSTISPRARTSTPSAPGSSSPRQQPSCRPPWRTPSTGPSSATSPPGS